MSTLTGNTFAYQGSSYTITDLYLNSDGTLTLDSSPNFSASANDLTLTVGNSQFAFSDSPSTSFKAWFNTGLSWSVGDTVSLSLTPPQTPATVSLSVSKDYVYEGNAIGVAATLSKPIPGTGSARIPVTITNGTAEPGDYTNQYGDYFVFLRGNSRSTRSFLRIVANPDTDADDETFTVSLDTANLPSGVTAGSSTSVQIKIVDDNDDLNIRLRASPNPVAEGSPVTVTATLYSGNRPVVLQHDVPVPVRVHCGGSAADDQIETVTVPKWRSSATAEIRTRRDSDGRNETCRVSLGSPLPAPFEGAQPAPPSQGGADPNALITGPDPNDVITGPGLVVSVTELGVPAGGTATYTVKLGAPPTDVVAVTPTVDDGTKASVSPSQLIFTMAEWGEAQTVTVSGAAAGETSIFHSVSTQDQALRYAVHPTVKVTVSATGQQGTNPHADLIAQMYDWRNDPQWSSYKAHTDRWDRALKAFGETVSDSALTAMTAAEAQAFADKGWTRWVEVAKALKQIEAAAAATATVTLAATPNPVDEGSAVTVTATLSAALAADVTIPLRVTAGTAESGDYGTAASLLIPSGGTSASTRITTADDTDADDETFTVALGALPSGVAAGDTASVAVTITDDDVTQQQQTSPHAALIAQMYEWRNDPQWRSYKSHTDRWDRALKAFGEPVTDASLTAMTAAEAQAFADKGWTRWVEVAKALKQIEGGAQQPAVETPVAPGIVTKRSVAREGSDDAAVFTVRLDRAATAAVTVDYATADGSGRWAGTAPAAAGADYTATSGTLTFAAGETAKTVSVPILDDAIDEGSEYFLLRLSNPQGATLEGRYRETQGLIRNSDPLQSMWLSRFGRMVASDAVETLTARLETPRNAGSHVTLAGQRLDLSRADDAKALTDALTGFAQAFGAREAPANDDDPFARHGLSGMWNDSTTTARSITGRELLLGTSFRAVLGSGAGSQWTSWGQGASVSRFSAAVPGLNLSGESATGSMGMDYESGRLLTGFALTHSVGEGTADDAGWRYAMGSTATMMLPYARLALSDRVSAWGMAGTGSGQLTLDLDGNVSQHYRTDLSMTLAATGVRGELVRPAEPAGFALALKADAFWVRTESDGLASSEFGALMGAVGESSRVRAVLDGSRTFALAGGATLAPSVELGLRHDGGDAETGTGLEFGAGLGYADPSRGLDMALKVHGLAAHAEQGYEEWGVSGSLRLVPGDAGRGLSASLTPSYGVDPTGTERLWASQPAASGLAANGDADPSSRFDAELGYGMALFGDRFTGTPNVGFGLSDTARDLRLGWRLTSALPNASGFEVNLDAVRREAANGNEPPEHALMLRSLLSW